MWHELYEDIARDCFRFLGFKSLDEVDRMTFREYRLLSEAHRLKEVDTQYKLNLLAWRTFAATATDKKGKPRYKRFDKFFDYNKALEEAQNKKDDKFASYKEHLRRKNG